jgi:CTP:molybdopterin cytidylyltransferase MocA
MGRVAAIVLAAGEASRFGGAKQHILLPRVLGRLRETSVEEIVVVEGAYGLERTAGTRIVRCHDWNRGPGASLRCGLAALAPEVECAVVVLADGPNLAPPAVERVLGVWREHGGVVAASYDGARGHPLVISPADWRDIPDEGLRDRPVALVSCDDLGAPGDIDTVEDLAKL